MLEQIVTSKTRVKLLTLFLLNPDTEMYVREISRRIEENINAVRRELANLEDIGLLGSYFKGNLKYFVVNKQMPIYEELKSIILKTEGVSKVLHDDLQKLGSIDKAYIYGSFASGKADGTSDIDVMIVGDVDEDSLIIDIKQLEDFLMREVNYTLYTPEEYTKRLQNKDSFLTNVLREPNIPLIGDANETK
ncbi:MAG: hypothetical protein GQ533_03000 [Methanosarcinaceae archaeon]|jgi:predicted nucleotidyltransferase|nr:hypothetical protein [Methanosarcinaceae archaeon]